jgi:hypothetical protein
MGNHNSIQSDTINWNNIDTENMSSSIPNLKGGISKEANFLLSKLNIPDISETASEFNADNILGNVNTENFQGLEDSDNATSPFISSELYNYMMKKYSNNQSGGANEGEPDSTSSTTSAKSLEEKTTESTVEKPTESTAEKPTESTAEKQTESPEEKQTESPEEKQTEEKSPEEKHIKSKKNKKSKKGSEKNYGNRYNRTTEASASYLSSSAQTGGSLSESVADENNYSISTVNTSDINMISE